MSLEDFKIIREELEKEYKSNCSKINELEDKIYLLKRTSFESRFPIVGVLSALTYFIVFALLNIIKFNILTSLFRYILFMGVPLTVGLVGNMLLEKNLDMKNRLKKFSKAKTSKEKLEEKTRYQIELEKVKTDNKIIKKVYNDLESKEQLIKSIEEENYITAKENELLDVNKLEKNISCFKELQIKNDKLLDNTVTKFSLTTLFNRIRRKTDKYFMITEYTGLAFILGLMLFNFPLIMLEGMEIGVIISLSDIIIPSLIGGSIGTWCALKDIKDKNFVFHKINDELGDDKITSFNEDYEKKINILVQNMSALKMEYETNNYKLKQSRTEEEKVLEKNYKVPELTKQPIGEIKKYYLENEFEEKEDEVLKRELPGQEKVKTLVKK